MEPFQTFDKTMSRSDPKKRKQREPKHTILLYGEGYSEKMFLEYIRGIYARGNDVKVTIKSGSGGSPEAIVSEALKEVGSFDQRIVIMDNDGKIKEMERAREKAKKGSIKIIENTPCLEGVLLSILKGKSYSDKSSSECKKEFESRYVSKQRRKDKEEYKKHFPKKNLDERRKHVKELDTLISLFEKSK